MTERGLPVTRRRPWRFSLGWIRDLISRKESPPSAAEIRRRLTPAQYEKIRADYIRRGGDPNHRVPDEFLLEWHELLEWANTVV
jgi:hypothetical protein